jgi:methyl-accepting chemotaxis protein
VAVVSERLEITDAFSAVFQRFNTMADRISNSLERIDNNLDQYINTNDRARRSTQDHGEQARKTSTDMTALAGTVGKLVAAFGGMAAIKGLVNLSDELTQTQARLDAINDGLQTSEQLNKMIFTSAQNARGSYLDMAQT